MYGMQFPPQIGKHIVVEYIEQAEALRLSDDAAAAAVPPPAAQGHAVRRPLAAALATAPLVVSQRVKEQARKLNELFRKTEAKPVIYFLPLSEDQVRARENAAEAGLSGGGKGGQ